MINLSDITILVNGKVEEETKFVLNNIRQLLPDSKIILSTWKNSDITGLDFDILVESELVEAKIFNAPENATIDAEGFAIFNINGREFRNQPKPNNVNRIIQTIQAGIKKVETKYLLRIRTDLMLKNLNFLKYWDKFEKYNGKYKIFEHRIINDSSFAQFAHVMKDGIQLLPFHMSDWLHFGLTEDIKLLYSCPFQNLEDSSQYWYKRERKQYEPFPDAGWQNPPETYVLYSLVKKHFPEVQFKDSDDYNKENMQISHKVIADNFIMIDDEDFKFTLTKYPKLKMWVSEIYNGFITHREWQYLYKIYCDKSYKFIDIDFKRFRYFNNIWNLAFLLKYPRRYCQLFSDFKLIFNKKKLREKFFIGVDSEKN